MTKFHKSILNLTYGAAEFLHGLRRNEVVKETSFPDGGTLYSPGQNIEEARELAASELAELREALEEVQPQPQPEAVGVTHVFDFGHERPAMVWATGPDPAEQAA